jgi:2'-5' RNA ligase
VQNPATLGIPHLPVLGWQTGSRKVEMTTTGTSSGRRQSAILIPVPQAEPVVGPYRLEYDPVAAAGVPAHVTLIVPWLPPEEIDPADLTELHGALDSAEPFDFVLRRVSWFGRKVLWLAPDPVEPFIKLTSLLADRFGTPPYDDDFDEIVPHLTVAHASDGVELAGVAADLNGRLADHPIQCQAQQVWVMVGDGQSWSVRDRFELRALQHH